METYRILIEYFEQWPDQCASILSITAHDHIEMMIECCVLIADSPGSGGPLVGM